MDEQTPDLSAAAADLAAAAQAGQVPTTAEAEASGTMPGGPLPMPPAGDGSDAMGSATPMADIPENVSTEVPASDTPAENIEPGSASALPETATAEVATEATPGEAAPDIAEGLEAKTPEVNANGVGASAAEEANRDAGVDAIKTAESTDMAEGEKKEGEEKKGLAAFLEKAKKMDIKDFNLKSLFSKGPNGEQDLVTGTATMFEVNLVPAIKTEMIRAMKMRNIVLFVAIVVIGACVGVVGLLGSITGAKKLTIDGQGERIDAMSKKINSFDGLSEYLTVKGQLSSLQAIGNQKKELSRIFSFLTVMLPSAPDSISLQELKVNLEDNSLIVEGYANAGVAPFIDYRVLESFKKLVQMVKYDFGRYVDAEDNVIPTRCIVEKGADGAPFVEYRNFNDGSSMQNVYAYWLRSKSGCDSVKRGLEKDLEKLQEDIDAQASLAKDDSTVKAYSQAQIKEMKKEIYADYEGKVYETWYDKWLAKNDLTRSDDVNSFSQEQLASFQKALVDYLDSLDEQEQALVSEIVTDGADVRDLRIEKIWRTPQFSDWYRADGETVDDDGNAIPSIDLSGTITGVAHFESDGCQSYSGTEINGEVMWTTTNDCYFSTEDVEVMESSNGRNAEDLLVLKFKAMITFDPEVFLYNNKHLVAIGPNGQNVTDSYLQINNMFAAGAEDCASSDTVCIESTSNSGSSSSSSSSSKSSSSSSKKSSNDEEDDDEDDSEDEDDEDDSEEDAKKSSKKTSGEEEE